MQTVLFNILCFDELHVIHEFLFPASKQALLNKKYHKIINYQIIQNHVE